MGMSDTTGFILYHVIYGLVQVLPTAGYSAHGYRCSVEKSDLQVTCFEPCGFPTLEISRKFEKLMLSFCEYATSQRLSDHSILFYLLYLLFNIIHLSRESITILFSSLVTGYLSSDILFVTLQSFLPETEVSV